MAGGHVAVAGALVLVAERPGRHAAAGGAADPAVLEAVVVPARLGAPRRALAVAEPCRRPQPNKKRRKLMLASLPSQNSYISAKNLNNTREMGAGGGYHT